MSIYVVVIVVIYYVLNGSVGFSVVVKGFWLKFYLSVKGIGVWLNGGFFEIVGVVFGGLFVWSRKILVLEEGL